MGTVYAIPYPPFCQAFINAIGSLLQIELPSLVPLDCIVPTSYYARLVLNCVWPLLVYAFLLLMFPLRSRLLLLRLLLHSLLHQLRLASSGPRASLVPHRGPSNLRNSQGSPEEILIIPNDS